MAWRKKMEKQEKKKRINWVTGPCDLAVVAGSDTPFGMGFLGNPPDINQTLHLRLKKIHSPSDGYTYWSNWLPEEKDGTGGYWAHLKPTHDPGFCKLRDFLNCDDFVALWNDTTLIKNVTFYKDSLKGPVISEAEACRLNELFDPDVSRALHEAAAGAGSSSDPPATESAPKRRRVFSSTSCAAETHGTLPNHDARCRFRFPAQSSIMPQPSLSGYRKRVKQRNDKKPVFAQHLVLTFACPFNRVHIPMQRAHWKGLDHVWGFGMPVKADWHRIYEMQPASLQEILMLVQHLSRRWPELKWGNPMNTLCAQDLWPEACY